MYIGGGFGSFPQVGLWTIFGYLKGAFRINLGSDHCCGLPSMLRRSWRYLGAFDPVYILQMHTQNVSLHQTNCLLFIVGLNLIHWMFVKAYRFCEYFAGDGNLTWCFKQFGYPGLSFDTNYGGRYNNIMEPAGFACLPSFIAWNVFENKLRTNDRQYVLATKNTTSISIWKLATEECGGWSKICLYFSNDWKMASNIFVFWVKKNWMRAFFQTSGCWGLRFWASYSSTLWVWWCLHQFAVGSPSCARVKQCATGTAPKGMKLSGGWNLETWWVFA